MRDILPELIRWRNEGKAIALATVVQTWGSSPRRAGSKMAITLDGEIAGSVSGGCVENAVVEAGVRSLKTTRPQLLRFGVADETAWEVGLACGGSIDVFVKPLDYKYFEALRSALESEKPAVSVTVLRGPDGFLGSEFLLGENERGANPIWKGLDEQITGLAAEALLQGASRRVRLSGEVEIFLEVIQPPPTLIVVGGVHIAVALTSMAKMLGYRTILIDPRRAWASRDRFPDVDRLIQAWPAEAFGQIEVTRSTAIAVLTHDPKLDDPALKIVLASPAFYIGALGSPATHARRRKRLLADAVSEAQLSRLHAPIGLEIGAQSPEEIALAVMAEVVETRRKREQAAAEADPVPHPIKDGE